nr:MAG TPA_asm: Rz lysis protein [Caudoviricetes sp.]
MTSKYWLVIAIELLISLLIIFVLYGRIGEESRRADNAESLAKQRQETINDMTVRQRDVAALDTKYTGELADAKATIAQLERDVAAGKRRLQVSARCPANGTASATSLDDGNTARLTDAAERDYFTLRERIATATKQLTGLQAYVRDQCLK